MARSCHHIISLGTCPPLWDSLSVPTWQVGRLRPRAARWPAQRQTPQGGSSHGLPYGDGRGSGLDGRRAVRGTVATLGVADLVMGGVSGRVVWEEGGEDGSRALRLGTRVGRP